MTDRPLMQIGAIAGVVGAIIFAVGNMMHPRSSDIEVYSEQIKAVSESGIWITDHLLFLFGALLMLGFLVALRQAIATGVAGAAGAAGICRRAG